MRMDVNITFDLFKYFPCNNFINNLIAKILRIKWPYFSCNDFDGFGYKRLKIYRVIQTEISIFWNVMLSPVR